MFKKKSSGLRKSKTTSSPDDGRELVFIVMYDDWGSSSSPDRPVAAFKTKADARTFAANYDGAYVSTIVVSGPGEEIVHTIRD
jgi:hypothetical protein